MKYLGREVRQTTRDLVVEAVSDNADHALLPGMFVTAHLRIGEETVPVVPKKALVRLDANDTVFVVVDGRLEQRVIQEGATRWRLRGRDRRREEGREGGRRSAAADGRRRGGRIGAAREGAHCETTPCNGSPHSASGSPSSRGC